jgi:hypothetical protein
MSSLGFVFAAPARADFNLCNYAGTKYLAAVTWNSADGVRSRGWIQLSLGNAAHPFLLDQLPMLTLECTEKILGEDLPQGQLADVLFSFRLNSLGILSVLMMRLVVGVGVE